MILTLACDTSGHSQLKGINFCFNPKFGPMRHLTGLQRKKPILETAVNQAVALKTPKRFLTVLLQPRSDES